MVGTLAIVAAVAWLFAFLLCAAVTRIPPLRTGAAAAWPGLAGERPALVNLVATRCQPNGAAYSATILDLAAKGHLMITQRMAGSCGTRSSRRCGPRGGRRGSPGRGCR